MIWTEEHDTRLVECIKANLSASQVGRLFGITRNAVLGRAYRKGLSFGQKVFWETNLLNRLKGAYLANKPRRAMAEEFGCSEASIVQALTRMHKRDALGYRPRPRNGGYRKPAGSRPRAAPKPPPPDIDFGMVTFREVTDWHCKFISGKPKGLETIYCGAMTLPDRPYCAEHWKVCHAVHAD